MCTFHIDTYNNCKLDATFNNNDVPLRKKIRETILIVI